MSDHEGLESIIRNLGAKMKQKRETSAILRRTATEVKKASLLVRAASVLCISLVAIITVTYAVSYFYNRFGSFTVSLNKNDMIRQGLSLSETPEFTRPIARLQADAVKEITNISGNDLPLNLNNINGQHNGENYIAYTFYLKNTGVDTVTYQADLSITNATNNIDAAIRVRVYTDGESVTYAKTKNDGSGPEYGTKEFHTGSIVMSHQRKAFAPGDMVKYTVVIWIEGDDPECVDSVIGGNAKLQMDINIVEGA